MTMSTRAVFLHVTVLALASQGLVSSVRAESPFKDAKLEAAVRSTLRLDDEKPLDDEALRDLYVLEAPGQGIKDLTGLEHCPNLALVRLSDNEITAVGPLKGLKNLQSLDLADNKIEDVGPLSDLSSLQYLELSGNSVSSIDALSKLEKLSALYLEGNTIQDVSPIAALTRLSSLHLAGNRIEDIGPLSSVTNLSTLDLNNNTIKDLEALKSQTELRLLMIENNAIEDLTPLVELVEADLAGEKRLAPFLRVYLAGNPLSDDAKTTQLDALKEAGVRIETAE